MKRTIAGALAVCLALAAKPAAQVNVKDTRLLHQPATNGTHVAFVYADDLWVARIDGTDLRRLTTDDGVESNPAFSPDGRQIAFTAQYEGNRDVYVVASEGGVPKRLTWHPGADEVQGFTPDGTRVLFTSPRDGVHRPLHAALHRADRRRRRRAAADPECRERRVLARRPPRSPTTRLAPRFEQWKQYRGGTVSRIWLFDTRTPGCRESAAAGDARQRRRRRVDRHRRCTSARTATASSISTPTTRRRERSRSS